MRTLKKYDDMQAYIFDQRAKSFDKLPWVTNRELTAGVLLRIFQFLDGQSKVKYLDVGTGTGEVLKQLSAYAKQRGILQEVEGVGIDISEEMIKIAKKKTRGIPTVRVERRTISGDQPGAEYGTFDFAICRNAFHHLTNHDRAVVEMRKLVREGGRVWIIEGVAPDSYTLEKWKDILLIKDVGRNRDVLLSLPEKNVRGLFSRRFHWEPAYVKELPKVPIRMSEWLNNAPITADKRETILHKINKLYEDPRFRESFRLRVIGRGSNRDYEFLRRSVLIEFVVRR